MKIIISMWKSKCISYKDDNTAITLRAYAHYMDGEIHGLNCAMSQNADFVILMEKNSDKREMINWLVTHPKPKNWGKILYQIPEDNDINDLEKMFLYEKANIDIMFIPISTNYDVYGVYGKPVVKYLTPYNFDYHKDIQIIPKKRKIALQANAPDEKDFHFMHLLYVIKNIPDVTAILETRQCGTNARDIISKLGLSDRITVIDGWKERLDYLKLISDCKVILSMETRLSMGHTQFDAACIGSYSVGWDKSPYQQIIYPEFGITPFNLNEAIRITKKALDAPDFKITKNIKDFFSPQRVIKKLENDLERCL